MNEDAANDVAMLQEAREIYHGVIKAVEDFISNETIATVLKNKYNHNHLIYTDDEEDSEVLINLKKDMLEINLKVLIEYYGINEGGNGFANFDPGFLHIDFGKHPTMGGYYQKTFKFIKMFIDFDMENNPWSDSLERAIKYYETVLIHELVHHFDDIRSDGKALNNNKELTGDNKLEIYSKPQELNAMFIQFINDLLRALKDGEIWHEGMDFNTFFNRAFVYASHMLKEVCAKDKKIQQIIVKRLYKIYDNILKHNDITGQSYENGRYNFTPF